MVKLKKLEELTVDVQRQLVGGNGSTGTCYCSCSCSCDCNCSCYCETTTYASSGTNRNGTNSQRIVGTRGNHRDSNRNSYSNGRKNEFRYNNR